MPTIVEPPANVIDVTSDVDIPAPGVDVPDEPVLPRGARAASASSSSSSATSR